MTKQAGGVSVDVTNIEPKKPISSGIYWRRMAPFLVPPYEEHLARTERGISMTAWYEMDEMERAVVIALRRLQNASENIQNEAQAEASERESKKRRR